MKSTTSPHSRQFLAIPSLVAHYFGNQTILRSSNNSLKRINSKANGSLQIVGCAEATGIYPAKPVYRQLSPIPVAYCRKPEGI
jgi:adenine/guanine phosphoribosyltransferase-like PRPP-binding protein